MASRTLCRAGTVAFRASKCPISRQSVKWAMGSHRDLPENLLGFVNGLGSDRR